MLKRQILACMLTVLGILYMGPSSAATLSFSPSISTVGVGGTVNVDVVISNLPPNDLFGATPVGAFNFIVEFDSQVLALTDVQFSNALGNPFDLPDFTFDNLLGTVDAANTSLLFFEDELADIQTSPSFTLATLSFQALDIGTSPLDFLFTLISDAFGDEIVSNGISGEVSVIPLPGAVWLMITGLLGIGALARKSKKAA